MKKLARILHLFRIFFPSWKFFDQAGVGPKLMYQLDPNENEPEPWLPALPEHVFGVQNLILNPWGNLHHAFNSLIERLLSEIDTAESADLIESCVSYQLVEQLVRTQILAKNSTFKNRPFRFKIAIRRPQAEDILISRIHEV